MNTKRFLVTDTSGRGVSVTLTIDEVREQWDVDYREDCESDDVTLGEFLDIADVGDVFRNTDDNATFTRVD